MAITWNWHDIFLKFFSVITLSSTFAYDTFDEAFGTNVCNVEVKPKYLYQGWYVY